MGRDRGEEIAGPLADVARLVSQLAAARRIDQADAAPARPTR